MTAWAAKICPSFPHLSAFGQFGRKKIRKIFDYIDKTGVGLHALAPWAVAVPCLVLNNSVHNIASLPCS